MRILLASVVFLGSLLGTRSAPAFAQEVLTNQSIEAILAPSSPPTASAAAPSPPPSAAPPGSVAMVPPAGNPARGRPTVYQIVGGKEVELMAAGTELQKNRMRDARTSELVLPGNKAKYRTADRQPVFVITSAPNEMPLVRLEPGGDDRNLKIGSGSRVPFGGGSTQRQGIRGEDMIDVDAEQDSRGFYRIRPRAALAPGEYGFVSTRGGGAVGGSVYDFGVD